MSGLRKSERKRKLPRRFRTESPPPPVRPGVAIDRFVHLLEMNTTADLLWDYFDLVTHIRFARTHKRALVAGGLSVLFPAMHMLSPSLAQQGNGIPAVWRHLTLPLTMRWAVPPGDQAVRFMANTGYAFTSVDLTGLKIEETSPVCKAVTKLKNLIVLNMNMDYMENNADDSIFDLFFQTVVKQSMLTLTTILLSRHPVTDQTLLLASQIHTLTHLNLYQSGITDDGLSHLSSLKLKHLCLGCCVNITDGGLIHLKNHPLEHLNLSRTRIGFIGLRHLKDLQLTRLELYGCSGVSDLSQLSAMPLTHLNISLCNNIRCHSIKALLLLPLEYIHVSNCSGILPKSAMSLLRIPSIKYVDMSFCTNIPCEMNQNGHWEKCTTGNEMSFIETKGKPMYRATPENCH
jgi:hypothetical protein